MRLLENFIIVGVIVGVVITGLLGFTINTKFFNDILTWIILIISIGAGIIIALIVDDRAKQSHNEVTTSQEEITRLVTKLDETDKKHNKILDLLKESNTAKEELATNTIISTLGYIVDMLSKLFNHVKPDHLQPNDSKLIENLLIHLESPINLIIQILPHTGNRLKNQKDELSTSVGTLRKIVIASIITTDAEANRTAEALLKNKMKLQNVLEKIKQSHVRS